MVKHKEKSHYLTQIAFPCSGDSMIATSIGPMAIVKAALTEADTVISILKEAAHWLIGRGLPGWNPVSLEETMLRDIQRGVVYLAILDRQPVGTITVWWSDVMLWGERPDDAGYIHKLAVSRAFAGHRIGLHLLTWAEAMIAGEGRPYARLDCQAANPTINRFYQDAGYVPRGVTTLNEMQLNLYEKSL